VVLVGTWHLSRPNQNTCRQATKAVWFHTFRYFTFRKHISEIVSGTSYEVYLFFFFNVTTSIMLNIVNTIEMLRNHCFYFCIKLVRYPNKAQSKVVSIVQGEQ